jgi:putative membrane protein
MTIGDGGRHLGAGIMTRNCHHALVLGAALLTLTACAAGSSGEAGKDAQTAPAFSAQDAAFLSRAGTSGLEEVTFARLVQTKAANQSLRGFAMALIADLTPVNQKLAALTESKGLAPPTAMDEHHADLYQRLQSLNGIAFDRGYLDGQLQELTMVIQVFQREADRGSDMQVQSLAQQNLPMLLDHLRAASVISGQ